MLQKGNIVNIPDRVNGFVVIKEGVFEYIFRSFGKNNNKEYNGKKYKAIIETGKIIIKDFESSKTIFTYDISQINIVENKTKMSN
jgi:hypothetical protein